jgi:TolB-like protein
MYMSPEQASGDPNTDARADIYALGAVAYEMLAGKPPFVGRSPRQLLSAHMTESPAAVDRQRAGIPAPLTALVMRCLEKRAGDRPQSAEEVSKELEAIAASSGESRQLRAPATGLSRRQIAWGALSVLVLVSAAGVIALRGSRAGGLKPNRIVVAPFINRTGDSTLDMLGPLTAEGVTRGLEQLDSVTVVSSYAGMRDNSGSLRRIRNNADLRAIGEETRAGRVISGSYSRHADSIRFDSQIIDSRDGHVEQTLDAVVGLAAAPEEAIERLRDNAAAALQVSAARPMIGATGHLPNLAAYREFITAFQTGIDGPGALPHLIKVGQLDSSFTLGLYWLAINYAHHGDWKQADSIVQSMAARRARFSPVEAELFASADGFVHSDYQKDLIAARQLFKRDSIGINAGGVVADAFMVNRPREALAALGHMHRLLPSNQVFSYWIKTAAADHMIADYAGQLAAATAGRKELGGVGAQVAFFDQQLRALAALRDTSRLRQKVDSFITAWNPALDERRNRNYRIAADPSELYFIVAVELSAHGVPREALAYANAGLAWHATAAGKSYDSVNVSHQSLADLLMFAGRLDAARVVWAKLAASDTLYTGARIQLAIIAAGQGDSVAALQTMHVLDSLENRPYAFGRPLVLKARIAAALGRKDDAVGFLQQAMDAGAPFDLQWHCLAEFQVLRDFVPFKVLLAPKG